MPAIETATGNRAGDYLLANTFHHSPKGCCAKPQRTQRTHMVRAHQCRQRKYLNANGVYMSDWVGKVLRGGVFVI
jgi:hypothetical protein